MNDLKIYRTMWKLQLAPFAKSKQTKPLIQRPVVVDDAPALAPLSFWKEPKRKHN